MISIPVKLFGATESKDIAFNTLHDITPKGIIKGVRDMIEGAYDPQQALTERERGAGPPHQLQKWREVAQCSQAFSP